MFGIYFKLQSFIFMPVLLYYNAMVRVAYNYGARAKQRIVQAMRMALIMVSSGDGAWHTGISISAGPAFTNV